MHTYPAHLLHHIVFLKTAKDKLNSSCWKGILRYPKECIKMKASKHEKYWRQTDVK